MDCQENEYWDQWGQCVTCQLCGPGQELSKVILSPNICRAMLVIPISLQDCGYGEGGDAYCTACPPRRFKSSWGHHRCQTCITCAVINRIQKANCTATSNAVCGDCLPRFYRKTRIGGLQDQECIPCTKQTPTSEVQCAFQLSFVKADVPTVPPQEATLVALMSSLLVVFTLAFLGLFFLYCKQFFNRHCQRVAGGSLKFEADEAAEEESLFTLPPGRETSPGSPPSERIFETQPLNPILDDDCSSTCGFPTQESFTMASCASESHSHWVHTPIECTELDLQKFSSSASCTRAETLRGDTAENSEDRLEFNMSFEVPSP
ncbi:tumor necrosis factor receptor superfamily member 27 isoform X2 [Ursus maritimus]|nr:tumor necrosis factor receptor superfamily member 27 isoform X2 [Ursus maritimus]XP_057168155.1 tumor necrosis factor receptor superfamily member 27 isoform X2 [Ursus arctos]XP_057168157.1 tumor necrosis factor receptor superfamily member 27 isoform X2 [Ursus arctos]XP_057168164.1 tumor necrosis factor receptor superfamily member 27 isoform X2 [Ursus arctos]XP_057168166.1 tumor necrosis factor receptor superfamily member 27 isoform X2 [Ursus arctos]